MNALTSTHKAFAGAVDGLVAASHGQTLADLIEFARTSWPHLGWTAEVVYQLRPRHSIEDVKTRLGNFQRREALKKSMDHWSYCRNREVTTRQFLALIEQFEADRRG